jgi:two-component sensor histidine kinase
VSESRSNAPGVAESLSLAEVRHRVANVFQLLGSLGRLRARRGDDPEARRQVVWMNEAITALGVLQNRLLSPGGDDFADFLEDMAAHWRRRVGARPVTIVLAAQPLVLPDQLAAALATIVHELVINALAHGFPDGRAGVVRIELEPIESARAALVVADDGVGYAPGGADRTRLGLWLIAGLADQVKGVLTTAHEGGVVTRLEFPTT